VSILLLAAVHCLKSIKLRLDLTALYIAGECNCEKGVVNSFKRPRVTGRACKRATEDK
jgi:hypothetical protein